MLQTSLHNAQVKDKILLKDFIKMGKDLGEYQILPENFFINIYQRISQKPLALHYKQKEIINKKEAIQSNFKMKKNLFEEEAKKIMYKSHDLRHSNLSKNENYIKAKSPYIKDILEIFFDLLLNTFSEILINSKDTVREICLKGFEEAIILTSKLELNLQRNKCIISIINFIKFKNIKLNSYINYSFFLIFLKNKII